jgi:hypothetical protein
MRGFFERRGREGFAESAEEDKERKRRQNLSQKQRLVFEISNAFYFWFYFCIFFFAPFAKPSRPLRSKNPRSRSRSRLRPRL